MMKNILNIRRDILYETVKFYSENKRNVDYDSNGDWGFCSYSGNHSKFKNSGNALGRYINKVLAIELDKFGEKPLYEIWDLLPDSITDLGISFWIQVSTLHDNCLFWENGVLSDEGLELVEYIEKMYCECDTLEIEILSTRRKSSFIKTTDWEKLTAYQPLVLVK